MEKHNFDNAGRDASGMSERGSVFRFKRFDCVHGSGSMKIGVDAVLVGAWADLSGVRKVLDVGTGCGVIALMCAQRNPEAEIVGIDVDEGSIAESRHNFSYSRWSDRLEAKVEDFNLCTLDDIDLIITNPPYFNSGVHEPATPRLVARHAASISPSSIVRLGAGRLSARGRIAMIVPADQKDEIEKSAQESGMTLRRCTWVKGHASAPVKRVLLEFKRKGADAHSDSGAACGTEKERPLLESTLVLELSPGVPTEEHRALCHEFYLRF